jgi:hypothetical protein
MQKKPQEPAQKAPPTSQPYPYDLPPQHQHVPSSQRLRDLISSHTPWLVSPSHVYMSHSPRNPQPLSITAASMPCHLFPSLLATTTLLATRASALDTATVLGRRATLTAALVLVVPPGGVCRALGEAVLSVHCEYGVGGSCGGCKGATLEQWVN